MHVSTCARRTRQKACAASRDARVGPQQPVKVHARCSPVVLVAHQHHQDPHTIMLGKEDPPWQEPGGPRPLAVAGQSTRHQTTGEGSSEVGTRGYNRV